MAEPLAIIGAVAAVSQVTGELVKLTTNLRHYLKVVRRAPEEIQAFMMETSNFTGLLNFFTELADNSVKDTGRREQRRRDKRVSMVQNQCAYVCDKMEYLVDRFAGLANENLTPLESLVERIRYLLDKPDIKDLRLSVQLAATTINTMSTLFLWEQVANVSLLEQLRNLIPMAKKASMELAAHQQRHGIKYESGMPDPNNAILAASKEIQRQVAQVIRPRSEAAENEYWGQSPRDSFGEQTSLSGPSSSPSGSGGSAADGVRHMPRRRANRVSFKTSSHSGGSHLGDHGIGASSKGAIVQPASPRGSQPPHPEFPSPPADSARNQSLRVPSRTSSEESKRTGIDQTGHDDQSTETHSIRSKSPGGHMALDVSDPMKPRIVRCNEECSSCGKSHCTRDYCLPSDLAELAKGKILDSNVPGGIIPPSKSQSATSNEGSSREGTRSSYEEQDPHSPLTTIESDEVSALSDAENSVIGRWSRTDVSLPSSASSSPSPRSPDAKNRNSTAVRPAENGGPREVLDPGKRASGVYEKRPQLHTEQEQSQHPGSAHEIQQPVARDMGGKEERGGGSEPAPYKPHISEDDVSSGQERPSPYVPMAPFGGPGGRRRPRRPQSKTVW